MNILNTIDSFLKKILDSNCFTNIYSTSRSILALGSLSTFIFSSPQILFDKDLFNTNNSGELIDKINIFYLLGYENLLYSYSISIIILLLVFSGFYPKFTGILHWIVTFSFQNASSLPDGGDQVAMIISFYLIPLTIFDNRKNHFNQSVFQTNFQNSVSVIITKFLIPLQVSVIYLHAAIDKLYKVEEWRNGTALYYILNDPLFGSSLFKNGEASNLLANKYIVVLLTWSPIIIEMTLFLALVMTYKQKKWLLYLGILFHLFIFILLGLFSFSCSMISCLVIYLLNPIKSIDYKIFFSNTKYLLRFYQSRLF